MTKSINTESLTVICPKCGAKFGQSCYSPSGKKYDPPHGSRIQKYMSGFTEKELRDMHTIKRHTFLDFFG